MYGWWWVMIRAIFLRKNCKNIDLKIKILTKKKKTKQFDQIWQKTDFFSTLKNFCPSDDIDSQRSTHTHTHYSRQLFTIRVEMAENQMIGTGWGSRSCHMSCHVTGSRG